ncbi:mas-related G-protein coupled receptor member H-like isoform X2 [Pseudonaja textilis]|uniref:mas-related G-protein coupled receptor member H-like isoform X2 n=1 Tax=Pseudonaja textilis TaxID=8673 RepID=UPI000EA9ABCA|nr:mas-related G-protein coupled receptor member H-like isoform X2 [Pseudonaja textilis]
MKVSSRLGCFSVRFCSLGHLVLYSSCSSISCRPRRMSSLDYERDPLFYSGDSSGDYHESSGLSTLITDMNFYNKTNKTFDKEIFPRRTLASPNIWPEVKMLYVTRSECRLVNIRFNNTKIVEIASNMSKISEIFSSPYDQPFDNLTQNLLYGFFAMICILGLVGNGMTIYLLAFSIKRNSFTTFILNLSIADFGVLTSLMMADIFVTVSTLGERNDIVQTFFFLFFELFFFTYSASQFLLTAISLDRCVAVLFPLWHRCHRPPYLPILVCGLIWILSFLLSVVHFILHQTRAFGSSPLFYQLVVNGLLCTPLMVVSTVTLLIHMRSKLKLNQRKLLNALLLALLFFLLFSLPMDVFYVIEYFGSPNLLLMTIGIECATLNSSINPLLYFLVGRKKRGKDQPRASLKLALQRVFNEEQHSAEEQQSTEENIL